MSEWACQCSMSSSRRFGVRLVCEIDEVRTKRCGEPFPLSGGDELLGVGWELSEKRCSSFEVELAKHIVQ